MQSPDLKLRVRDYWDEMSCGEVYALDGSAARSLSRQEIARYALEPYIEEFARYADARDKDVLEIGVGMGADHARWASGRPRSLTGIDLTARAIDFTRLRFAMAGYQPRLYVADAERLPFPDASFDLVYSWGVLHHSPDTARCFAEVKRVLRSGGVARVMIYHKWSLVGPMLWLRYGLLSGRCFRSLDDIYFHHLESPGTKCYDVGAARRMVANTGFSECTIRVQLTHGDLLQGAVGQRHRGFLLDMAKRLWPRFILRKLAAEYGHYLLIEARR